MFIFPTMLGQKTALFHSTNIAELMEREAPSKAARPDAAPADRAEKRWGVEPRTVSGAGADGR